ncbi:MAG: hypothetical protein A2Z97_16550, partial [Bdellovibrionales bacterium GWB1_52_6]
MIPVLITLAFVLPGCSGKIPKEKAAILHDSLSADPRSLDPAIAYDSNSLKVLPNILETLYQYDYLADGYRLIPLLAADMPRFSKDRLTIRIPLRKDIRFQDDPCFKETQGKGRTLKAQDFVYAFKRLADPSLESPGWWLFDSKLAEFDVFRARMAAASSKARVNAFARPVRGVRALDDFTLQLTLVKPFPQLLYALAMTLTAPVPHEAVTAYGDENGSISEHPVGTGAFLLKKWDRDQSLQLLRNPGFHSEFYPTKSSEFLEQQGFLVDAGKLLPFLDGVTLKIIKEPQPAWASFTQGELDLLPLSKDHLPQAITSNGLAPALLKKQIRLALATGNRFTYLSFNTLDPVLRNKTLRQALSRAVNRDEWIALSTNNTAAKMTGLILPGIADRPASTALKFDYDLKRAKALLARAGYPEGRGLPPLRLDMRGADSRSHQLGKFLTSQFAALGVKIEVIYNTFPDYMEKQHQGKLQLASNAWALDYPDAENILQLLYGPNRSPGSNDSNFNHPKFNQLYEQMAVMDAGPARATLIQKMDEIAQEEAPWILGYHPTDYLLSQPRVKNLKPGAFSENRYKYLRRFPAFQLTTLSGTDLGCDFRGLWILGSAA